MAASHSAPRVHLICWNYPLGLGGVKILDSLGMKYTHPTCRLLALLATFALACSLPAPAQSDPYPAGTASLSAYNTPSTSDDPQTGSLLTIHKRVDEVNVLFIATDKHGKFVRDLNQTDFAILDDHKPPQSILNFRRETDLPLHLGLLIDVSGSVHSRFDFEQDAAISFLQHSIRAGFDKAFIVGFNTQSQMSQDFTDNVQLLSAGVHKLQDGGGTALYDAIYRASKEKFLKDRPDRPVRKAIVVVSDGEDNQSEYSRAQAIEMAQRAEVIIYAISTDDSGLVLRGDKVLEQLAEATGGRAFFPFKMKDITHSFAAIEDELRSQYVVSYKPADFDADGRYRSIEISALKKDLQVRARKGYFAPQQ
jgi:Ca-activated chloride channel family protein